MAELLMIEAINDCFHTELARDESVMVMGEDVARSGGVFRATAGLLEACLRAIPPVEYRSRATLEGPTALRVARNRKPRWLFDSSGR